MGDEVEELERKLAVSEARCATAEARCVMLEEQVRIVQRDRDTFAQQLRQMMVIVERLDRRFGEVLEEMTELKAERATEIKAEVAGLVGQVGPEPALNPAPTPPAGSGGRKAKEKKGRHAHGRNTKAGFGLAAHTTDETVAQCEACGGVDLRVIDTVEHKQWDYVRGHFRQRVHRCRTVRCNHCLVRTTAQPPPPPFPRASCTSALLAYVLYLKFGLYLPLERQLGELRLRQVPVPQPTLVDWVRRGHELFAPIVAVLWAELMAADVLHFDGTSLKVLRGPGKAHPGHIYVFATAELAVYKYLETKHGERILQTLEAFGGTAIADAEPANNAVFASGERVEGGCCAHAFRKFKDCLPHDPVNASEGMAWLAAAVFRVEERAKALSLCGKALLAYRREHAAPLVAQFRIWLDVRAAELLPESSIGKAISYCRTQWDNLMRFLTDPAVDPTNNAAERLLKPAALLRKNCVFAGSDAGADRGATMLTVVNTCRLVGVDAEAYIVWALDRMAERRVTRERLANLGGGPAPPIRYDDLTPAAHKALTTRPTVSPPPSPPPETAIA
jgi:transposase